MPRNSLSGTSIKKQFIAGARCSACQAIDTTLWVHGDGVDYTHCVDCAHESERPLLGADGEALNQAQNQAQASVDQVAESVVIFKPSPAKNTQTD